MELLGGSHLVPASSMMEPPATGDLVLKVQEQARRLVEQQRQLVCAIAYARRCEQRIRQLDPSHRFPVSEEHLEQIPVERAPHAIPRPWTPPEDEAEPPVPRRAPSLDMALGAVECDGAVADAASAPAVTVARAPRVSAPSRRMSGPRESTVSSKGRPSMSGAPKGATVESLRVERSKLQSVLLAEREAAEKYKADTEREISLLRRARGVTQDGAALLVQLEQGREHAEELQVRTP